MTEEKKVQRANQRADPTQRYPVVGIKQGAKAPFHPLHHPEDQDHNQDTHRLNPKTRTSTQEPGIIWT